MGEQDHTGRNSQQINANTNPGTKKPVNFNYKSTERPFTTTPLTQGLRTRSPSPHTEEAARFLAPDSAPLPRPLPVSTHPKTADNTRPGFPRRPRGHQHITPPRKHSANTHGGRAGGRAGVLATPPRAGPLQGKPSPGARPGLRCPSCWAPSRSTCPLSLRTSFCKPRPRPAPCEAPYKPQSKRYRPHFGVLPSLEPRTAPPGAAPPKPRPP